MTAGRFDAVIYEAAARGSFPPATKSAAEFAALILQTGATEWCVTIGGYDADPRELYDIPEVMEFMREFCAELPRFLQGRMTLEAFLDGLMPESKGLVMLAAGIIGRHQIIVEKPH